MRTVTVYIKQAFARVLRWSAVLINSIDPPRSPTRRYLTAMASRGLMRAPPPLLLLLLAAQMLCLRAAAAAGDQEPGTVIPAESRPCVDCHAFEFMQRALQDLKKTAFNLDARTETLVLRAERRALCDCMAGSSLR